MAEVLIILVGSEIRFFKLYLFIVLEKIVFFSVWSISW